jgi:hypothetical protein
MTNTCILLPSARQDGLDACLETLRGTPAHIAVSLYNVDAPRWFYERGNVTAIVRNKREYDNGAVWAWNDLLRTVPHYDYYVLAADDLRFVGEWLEHAHAALDSIGGRGLVAFNDLHSDGNEYAAHWIASRDFIVSHLGGVMYPPHYVSWWADREVSDIAKQVGQYVYAEAAVVHHMHPTFGAGEDDKIYTDARAHHVEDLRTLIARRAVGYPKDYAPIIK